MMRALTLAANNAYTGATTVGTGYLQVLNTFNLPTDSATSLGPVNVFPRAFLLGGNAAGTAGQITGPVNVAGTLAAGTLESGFGILTVRNNVTFSPNGTGEYLALLGGNTLGTQYSQLRVIGGNVVLNNALFTPNFSGTPTGPMTIIDVTGGTVSGLFTNSAGATLADGAVFTTFNGIQWVIDYTPTSVIVAPVPEPGTVLALCAGAAGIAGLVRRVRRGRVTA
jgi:PEP-CTERM motif